MDELNAELEKGDRDATTPISEPGADAETGAEAFAAGATTDIGDQTPGN
jgi:hypothetical protein